MCIHNSIFILLQVRIWEKFVLFFLFVCLKGLHTLLKFQNMANTAGRKTKRASFPSGSRHQNFEHNPKTEINLTPHNILVN